MIRRPPAVRLLFRLSVQAGALALAAMPAASSAAGEGAAASGSAPAKPQVATPNPHGSFKQDCALCHRAESWTPAKSPTDFDHSKTGFPLDGSHKDVPCLLCHTSLEFAETSGSRCADCHQDVHRGEMGMDCARCHDTRDFIDRAEAVRKHRLGRFPLTGAHLTTDCAACHRPQAGSAMRFAGTSETCEGCHMADYQAAKSPDHVAGGFSTDCAACHSTSSFAGGTFDHSATAFPLTGAHTSVQCAACHGEGPPGPVSAECASCHRADYDATLDPPHAAVGFPTDCASCHSTVAWGTATFDHAGTGFPLTGAHVVTSCADCHGGATGSAPPSECVGCHRADYDGTTAPSHASVGFPTDCVTCHGTASWDGASFDHASTGFPLTGRHLGPECAACHGTGPIGSISPECVDCHRGEYDASTDPNHAAVGFSTDCASCHGTSGWPGATFNHSTTGFPLTGAHLIATCAQCHGGSGPPPLECVGCHRADYDGTTSPSHASVGFPTDCVTCHGTASWDGASFDHASTGFPLTGRHAAAECAACHGTGPIGSLSPECVDCHRPEYDATTSPPHAGAGFPTDCAACHGTTGWDGATFDHDGLYFPIYSGRHRGEWSTCADCHVSPTNYSVFECILCHQHSDRAKVDRDHQGESGYSYNSAACYRCHPDGRS